MAMMFLAGGVAVHSVDGGDAGGDYDVDDDVGDVGKGGVENNGVGVDGGDIGDVRVACRNFNTYDVDDDGDVLTDDHIGEDDVRDDVDDHAVVGGDARDDVGNIGSCDVGDHTVDCVVDDDIDDHEDNDVGDDVDNDDNCEWRCRQ